MTVLKLLYICFSILLLLHQLKYHLCCKHCSLFFNSSDLKQISILVLLSVVGTNLQLKFSLSSSLPGVPFSGMQFAFDNIFGLLKVE